MTVLGGFIVVQLINLLTSPLPSHGRVLAVGLTSIFLVGVFQVFNSSAGAARWPLRRRLVMLAGQGIVTFFPLLVLGQEWGSMAGFLAGSVLLLLPGWTAWATFTAIIVSMMLYPIALRLGPYSVAYLTVADLDTGLVVFGLSRLSAVVTYAHATRGELAQMAVINERMRFARDLHDLLGYSLSAITLKAELTRRLVTSNPGRARDELAEVLDVARQALADVRLVASGYRNFSLAKEASSVTSLLTAAGIAVTVQVNYGALDEKVDTVMATVLREAVTNMLRHSTAQSCSIEADESGRLIRLRVSNDGAPRSAESGLRADGGLANLVTRLNAIGGQLTVTARDGWFELLAETPAVPEEQDREGGRT